MMLKRYIKKIMCLVILTFTSTFAFASKNEFGVLCYHNIVDESISINEQEYYPQTMTVQTLVNHFNWLKHNGYTPVSWQQILDAKNGGTPLPEKAVLLTFDDGYESFYTVIYPLLKAYNYPAVYAIVTDWINTPANKKINYGKVQLDRKAFLSWAQLREMQNSGLIEIASHTDNMHYGVKANPAGSSLPAVIAPQYKNNKYETVEEYRARLKKDFQRSYQVLKTNLGVAPRIMIWPYGQFTDEAVDIAKQAGFLSHFSLRETKVNTPDDPHVGRLLLDTETSISTISKYLEQKTDKSDIQRTVRIKLDEVYDPNPTKLQQNVDVLVERMHQYGITAVYLQAFSDANNDGMADALYFKNQYLPVRADIFSYVAWALRTRAEVEVYAWMPESAFALEQQNKLATIKSIYRDLSFYSKFDGIFFQGDTIAASTNGNLELTKTLKNVVTPFALGGEERLKTARAINMSLIPSQNLSDVINANEGFNVIMVAPYSANNNDISARDAQKWIDNLVKQTLELAPKAKLVFELQTIDEGTQKAISDDELSTWMANLPKMKVYSFGYQPDKFLLDQPTISKIRPYFSLSTDVGLK
ncbi:poly-beta-1,6-N-acetyl-D-glucosamine N-deacetylase PgaB [Glaesserella sp.]|uniref:poly-beta-1,6-N-acetyl-D-glucosamine N-deacetylase PgaB n=1 Tax=Glaesserella sp. TaxID=2094731 RepID=UPI00359FDC87